VRGRLGGRPRKLSSKQIEMAQKLMKDSSNSIKEICATLRISLATLSLLPAERTKNLEKLFLLTADKC